MSKVDGRKIPHKIREETRFEAIEEWKQGVGSTALALKYGTSKKIIHDWINRYKQGGSKGLKTRTGKTGVKPYLSLEQRNALGLMLRTQTPEDYGYQTVLWTCPIIASVIKQRFSVNYVPESVRKILKAMGFTAQKPRWSAWQQDKKKLMNG